MKQKKTLRTSEESCVIIAASSTITTTEEAADYVKNLNDHKSVIGRFTSCTLVWKYVEHKYSYEWKANKKLST